MIQVEKKTFIFQSSLEFGIVDKGLLICTVTD